MSEKKNESWNGNNSADKSDVGNRGLISEESRKGKTASKYDVSNDTLSADDNLQTK